MPPVSDQQGLEQNGSLPATEQNGPIANGQKSWQRAWSITEIRQTAANWSLAGDSGLLKCLQEFSNNLTKKAHESTLAVNNLLHDTQMSDARLKNVTDRFLTLSDSQFIENRVYDEDVNEKQNEDAGSKTENGKDNESETGKQEQLSSRLSEALQSGLKVLDEAFDILDANAANSDYDSDLNSDSEDEAAANGIPQTQGIYEPKDPYVARPLPHLIGSRGFHELDDVGVADLPSDDEVQDDHGSISESDEEVEETKAKSDSSLTSSSSEYDSEEEYSDAEHFEHQRTSTKDSSRKSTLSSSSDENLFGSESEDSDASSAPEEKPKSKKEVKSGKTKKQPQKSKPKPKQEEPDLFQNDQEEEDLFGNAGGLFGTGTNLFKKKSGGLFEDVDEEDEKTDVSENSSFSDSETEAPRKKDAKAVKEEKPAKKTYGGVSLFGGAVAKDFFGKNDQDEGSGENASQKSGQSGKKKDFFDSEDDSDDGLFSEKPPPLTKKKATSIVSSGSSTKKKEKSLFDSSSSESEVETVKQDVKKSETEPVQKKSDLFASDSEDEDLFAAPQAVKTKEKQDSGKRKAPIGGVSMFGGGKQGKSLIEALKSRNANKPKGSSESSSEDEIPKAEPTLVKPPLETKKDDLFDSDSDDEAKLPPIQKSSPKPASQKENLYDRDSDEDKKKTNPPVVQTKPKPTEKKGGLFDDDSDEDDFFKIPPKPATNKKENNISSIFSDSDSDDMFSSLPSKKPVKSSGPPKTSSKQLILDDSGSDNDLFSTKPPELSLFSDEDNNKPEEVETTEEKDENDEAPPKKKPVGAVPMFMGSVGGAELSAAISKRRSDSHDSEKSSRSGSLISEEKKTEEKPKENASKPVEKESGWKPKAPSANVTAKPFKPMASSFKTSIESKGAIGKLSAKLTIDPTALLPGAAPKSEPVVQKELSFEQPPSAKTLENFNKTRARGQANRRPPTRRGKSRTAPVQAPTPELTKPVVVPRPAPIDENLFRKEPQESTKQKEPQKDEIDGIRTENEFDPDKEKMKVEDGDVFSSPKPTSKPTKSQVILEDLDDELFSGPLFEKQKTPKVKESKVRMFDSNLFGEEEEKLDTKKEEKSKPTMEIFDDDENDIFGDLSFKSTKKKASKDVKMDTDDIFAEEMDISLPKSQKDPAPEKILASDGAASEKVVDDIFGDDEDIFAGSSILGDKTSKPKTKEKSKASKTKKKVEKEGLFGSDDDTDIFATTKSKPSASKKTKKENSSSKSIFDEDDSIDDIFKSKPKKSTAKSSKKKTAAKKKTQEESSSNIFDDPLSLP